MDKAIYIASNAARETMLAQVRNANNLANATTTGFRSDFAYAQSMAMKGAGHNSRAFAMTQGVGANFASGTMMTTGRELDVAINGAGWFAVQGVDGTEALTRAGDLRVTPAGLLTTAAGHPVVGNNGGPITIPPFEKLEIGADGTVSIRPVGQEASALAVVDRIKMANPDKNAIAKSEDGLFRMKDGTVSIPDGTVTLVSGALENSNVNVVESMVTMMELSKKFEMQVKVMEKANELDQASQAIMKMS